MEVLIRFLGELADAVGVREDKLYFEDGIEVTVEDAIGVLKVKYPKFRDAVELLPMVWVFVNGRQVLMKEKLKDGDVLNVMPPLYEGG